MFLIGLTGGIGSRQERGRAAPRGEGAVVIRADDVAREIVAPGTDVLRALVAAFGESVVAADGALDRRRLAGVAFASDHGLARLNEIVHPPLVQALIARVEAVERERDRGVLVVEAALLAEWDILDLFDLVVVVRAPLEARLARLERGGLARDGSARAHAGPASRRAPARSGRRRDRERRALGLLAGQVDGIWQTLPDRREGRGMMNELEKELRGLATRIEELGSYL